MKKILFLAIALITLSCSAWAQKFIDVYQNGRVAGSMFSADIDSINISGEDASRRINFWGAGNLTNSFLVNTVDSIKVYKSEDAPWVYLGILGFNQELYTNPIGILATSTSNVFSTFVNNLTRKDGTLLYYGVEQALDILSQYNFTTPLSSVNLITFTDGLDQGSLMMTTKYEEEDDYIADLSKRINSIRVRGLPLTAYSLGLRGNDVTNYSQFQANLRQLATSSDKAIEVSSMYDVQSRLQEIADQIISISNRQTISVKIPGQSNDTRVRFTLDGNSPDYSSMYIEGTFNLSDRSLRNVVYHGIKGTSGTMVTGVQEGIFVTYTFTGLQRTDGNGLIPTGYIRHYNQGKGSTTWQINSEFTPAGNTQTTVTHSGAAIMLVLDCSSSLGSQFSNMQSYAQNFISRVANNAASFKILAPSRVSAVLEDDEMVVDVTWDAVKYAECYQVYRNGELVADSIPSTSWQDNTPQNGSNYYTIRALGHGLTSAASSQSETVTCEIAAPTNVTATLSSDEKSIRVFWDAVKYAESYTIYRSINASSDFSVVAEGVTLTNWTDNKPGYGTIYYQVVAARHGLTGPASPSSNMIKIQYIVHPEENISITVNGVSFNMIKVESGTFQMGGNGEYDGKPVHQVTLTNDYYIGETEVTQELWMAVMGSNPSRFTSSNKLPVEMVSWDDCQTFITKLNALTGKTFRLPTEAEWEFAARGGNASQGYTYSGSNTIGNVAWYDSNSSYKTHEVATKARNELGIYDMSGNVWEWCQDWYGSYSSGSQTNPTGPTSGSLRVIRGGSWGYNGRSCRVAFRLRYYASCTDRNLGLRLAL